MIGRVYREATLSGPSITRKPSYRTTGATTIHWRHRARVTSPSRTSAVGSRLKCQPSRFWSKMLEHRAEGMVAKASRMDSHFEARRGVGLQ